MAAKLQDAGIDSFTIFEKADEVGGTWRDNTYPGLTCDVPSRYYSYSFRPNPNWSHWLPPGPEIQAYFRQVADERGIRRHIRFGSDITRAEYDDGKWRLTTADGEETFDVLVTATGVLRVPRYPEIPGRDTFAGPAFHSSRWDHSVSLPDKRIGLIGTGSTGVQITAELGGTVRQLKVFQRTAQWVYPLPNPHYSKLARAALSRWPALNALPYRFWGLFVRVMFGRAPIRPGWQRRLMQAECRWNLRLSVRDPELRAKLTPTYQPMCKRQVMAGHFYRSVQQPGVEVITDGIDHIEPRGIVTADGTLHELDLLVYATGFDARAYVRPLGGDRGGRTHVGRGVGRRPDGVPVRRGARIPQPVHADGAAFADRQPITGTGRRGSGQLRDVVDQAAPRRCRARRSTDRSGHQGIQREHESGYATDDLDHRLQQLVPWQGRLARAVPLDAGNSHQALARTPTCRLRRAHRLTIRTSPSAAHNACACRFGRRW